MTLISHPCTATLIVHKLSTHRLAAQRVPAAFSYDATTPYVVTLSWGAGNTVTFGREQLAAGVVEPMITPAVVVQPRLSLWIEITVRDAGGRAHLLSFDRADIDQLLAAVEQLVPAGTEGDHVDADAALARWIASERSA